MSTKVIKGSYNLNTTIDKIAMSEFKMHYINLVTMKNNGVMMKW